MPRTPSAGPCQLKGAMDRDRRVKVTNWHEGALQIAKAVRSERADCTKITIAKVIHERISNVPAPNTLVRWLTEQEDLGELSTLGRSSLD